MDSAAGAGAMLAGMGHTPDNEELRLFHTGEHPCGYWPDRYARDLVLDPRDPRLPQWLSDGA